MEPRIPGIPYRHPSTHIPLPPPSPHSLFPDPRFMHPDFGRIHPEGYPQQPHHYPHPPLMPPPFYEIQESIGREIEKSRIREEIIMAQAMRRHMLESEVRRELMMEREFGVRRGTDGFPSPVMGFNLPVRLMVEEERSLSLLVGRERLKGNFEGGLFDDNPFQRGNFRVSEVGSVLDGGKLKERIILLPKPGDISGSKRKADVMPSAGADAGGNLADRLLKKRAKEEWSCALCRVSATSEFAFKEHLGGKRHKRKEAQLKEKAMGKSHMKGAQSKKTLKIEGSVKPAAVRKLKLKPPSLPSQMVLKDKNHPTASQTLQQSNRPKKQMKFYCELCQVGANVEKVMEGHKNGKKHLLRLLKFNKDGTNQSKQLGLDEKPVASDKFDQPSSELEPLDSDLVPSDGVEPEECKIVDEATEPLSEFKPFDSDHVHIDTVKQEECSSVDEADTNIM